MRTISQQRLSKPAVGSVRILTWAKEEDVKRPREEVSEEEEDWMDASVSEEEKDMKCHDLPLSTNLPSPVSKRPRRGMLLALLCL